MARLALLALLLSVTPASAQTVHRLPAGSSGHVLELALDGAPAGALAVRVAEAPAWLAFASGHAEAAPDTSGTPVAALRFSVSLVAPVAVPSDVRLHVVDAAGAVRAEHVVRVEAGAPAALALRVPRPNPSAGAVTVAWAVPEAGPVRVSVFDALGREVRVLAEGASAAGGVEAVVPAGALAAGAYVVRLATPRETRVQRLTVVR